MPSACGLVVWSFRFTSSASRACQPSRFTSSLDSPDALPCSQTRSTCCLRGAALATVDTSLLADRLVMLSPVLGGRRLPALLACHVDAGGPVRVLPHATAQALHQPRHAP